MRDNKLFDRIKIAYRFIRYGKGCTRIMKCGKCGSVIIVPISEKPLEDKLINDKMHVDQVWSEYVQCCKCGAVCKEIQLWNFAGDPLGIDKDLTVKKGD